MASFILAVRKRASTAGVVCDEGFEHGGDLVLLAARKLGCSFEQSAHLAGWSCSSSLPSIFTVFTAEKFSHRDIESLGATADDFQSGINRAPFVVVDHLASGAERVCELSLGEALGFA